jgi:hypothetical protein
VHSRRRRLAALDRPHLDEAYGLELGQRAGQVGLGTAGDLRQFSDGLRLAVADEASRSRFSGVSSRINDSTELKLGCARP